MTKTLYFTESGYQKLLKEKKRLEAALAEAKKSAGLSASAEPGNVWHDNFGFEQAERDIHKFTSMLEEIMKQLASAKIIKPKDTSKDKAGIGSKVQVEMSGEKRTYSIVGWGEAEPGKNKISYTSPLGKALTGAKTGDRKRITTPKGKAAIKVLAVS